MNVIQTELTEALADLSAKCPGASLHVSVHHAPLKVFTADDVTNVRVVNADGKTWLSGRAERSGDGFSYRVEFYSVDLPQAEAPELEEVIGL